MFLEIEGVLFPQQDQSPQAIKHLRGLVAEANGRRKKLRAMLKSTGDGKGKGEAQKVYLGSKLVRLSALVEAAKNLPFDQRLSILEYEALAAGLQLHAKIPEKVRFFLKSKPSGQYRCICVFGARHRAAQSMVADMVDAQFSPQPFQHNVAGKGIKSAVAHARKYFEEGLVHAIRLDVGSFYDKFHHAELMTSGLTQNKVMEHVVIGRHYELEALNVKGGYAPGFLSPYIDAVHSHGIAQGSVCSPTIGNFYISKLKAKLPSGTRVLNYADDFLVLAKSGESLEKATNALKASVEALSVGTFELLEKSSSSSVSGVEFLGHHFGIGNGSVTVSLTAGAQLRQSHVSGERNDRFDTLLNQKSTLELTGVDTSPFNARIMDLLTDWAKIIKGWRLAYSEVDNIDEEIDHHASMLFHCCDKAGVDPKKLFSQAKAYSELGLVYGAEGSWAADPQ